MWMWTWTGHGCEHRQDRDRDRDVDRTGMGTWTGTGMGAGTWMWTWMWTGRGQGHGQDRDGDVDRTGTGTWMGQGLGHGHDRDGDMDREMGWFGAWYRDWGHSQGSGKLCRPFEAVGHGPDWGRAGDSVVADKNLDSDMVAVAKRHVYRVPEANRVVGMESGRGLRVQVDRFVVSELWARVLSGAEQGS
jgi:hypothetical protein